METDGVSLHSRKPHPRRGRRYALVLAATLLMLAAGVAAAGVPFGGDPQPPVDLQEALSASFGGGECVAGSEAVDRIRASLDGLGYHDWAIASSAGVRPMGCVAPGFLTSDKLIVLVPVDGPEVAQAMQGVAEELMSRCLGKEEATEFVSSVLATVGVTDASIRTDGPFAYPVEQEEVVRSHVALGCFVYSGSGRGPGGEPIYYISGPGA